MRRRYLVKDPNHAFSLDDLRAWERKHGRVPKGAFAALRTDMSKDWDSNPERFKRSPFPAWSLETVKFLVEQRGVTAIGHESLDTDTTDKMESETYILQKGRYQIEVMANLDQGAGDWRTHRRGLAQGQGRLRLSRARFCHLAVMLEPAAGGQRRRPDTGEMNRVQSSGHCSLRSRRVRQRARLTGLAGLGRGRYKPPLSALPASLLEETIQ